MFIFIATKPSLDLVFIMGASGNNRYEIFNKQKEITKHFLTSYNTSAGKTHVGIISNGRPADVALPIGKYHGSRLTAEIDKLPNSKSEVLLDSLNFAKDRMFTAFNGARPGVKKSLVVFVNDKVKSDKDAIASVGKKLKNSGINVIVIGMDQNLEKDKIEAAFQRNDVFFFPPLLEEMDMLLYPVVRASYPGM